MRKYYNKKIITLEDIHLLSQDRVRRKSIYYLTYDDIVSYYDISYSLATKFMTKLVNDYEYLRKGSSNEAHFVLSEHIRQYEEFEKKWKEEKRLQSQSKKSADLRGWFSPVHINKLQLNVIGLPSNIGKQFYQVNKEYKKSCSDVVVFSLFCGSDIFKFVVYPNGVITIHVHLVDSISPTIQNLKSLFNNLRYRILTYSNNSTTSTPFSFIITQIYTIRVSLDKMKAGYKEAIFNKGISLALPEVITFLNDKYEGGG